MYFLRTRKLDIPKVFRHQIENEIDKNIITPTGMSDKKDRPAWDIVKERVIEHKGPDKLDYYQMLYNDTDLIGHELSPKLTKEIYNHYDSFIKMIPDEPKIIIKKIISEGKKFYMHCGKLQLCSLTCLIKGQGPETVWYEPLKELEHKFRVPGDWTKTKQRNKYGQSPHPSEVERITSIKLKPWEMIIFDHNSIHEVEDFTPGMERWLFSIGFLNITATELEDIYYEWVHKERTKNADSIFKK